MLAEILTYLTTPCPGYVREMGYLYEAIAVQGRYRRNRASWQPHLEQARRFICAAAEGCLTHETAVIIGSGLLLDVPLDELARLFREVVLIDIVHLREARRQAKRYGNVRIRQHDVTGVAQALVHNIAKREQMLPEPVAGIPGDASTISLVVSLNVLSQLAVKPGVFAGKRMHGLNEARGKAWCRRIVETHYAALSALPCDVVLISDFASCTRDRQGRIVGEGSTVHGLSLPAPDARWAWEIAPFGEEARDSAKTLQVGAWHRFAGSGTGLKR